MGNTVKNRNRISIAQILVLLFVSMAGLAVQPNTVAAQTGVEVTAADTSSPRSTLKDFIDACNALHRVIEENQYVDRGDPYNAALVAQVLDCIDATGLPEFAREEQAAEVAVCIKEILDRHRLPPWEDIPDLAAIEAAGGFEKLSRWRIPGTRITIARIDEGPQKHEYLFSKGTVDRAVEYYESIKSREYRAEGPAVSPGLHQWYLTSPRHEFLGKWVKRLPDYIRFGRSMGMANWKWAGLLVAFLVTFVLMAILYGLHLSLARKCSSRSTLLYCMTIVLPICAMLVPLLFRDFALEYLSLRGNPLYVVSFAAMATTIVGAVIVVFAMSNRIADLIIASPHVNPQGLNAQLIRIASKLMSFSLSVVVLLYGGQYLGIPVTTLLASAGIGGIALAFAAQDTLKTLFGTLTLMADKPFRVGDRIIVKDYDGFVEDIGLRSTRVRLLSANQVTIPNDQLAGSDIENVGRRKCIRRVTDIHIPLDTPHEKLETAVDIIRGELQDHEGMDLDYPPRVYFVDFVPTAFTIRVIYWYHPPNYWDYLAFGERFNLGVCRAFDQHGIRFSLPQRLAHTSLEGEQAPIEVQLPNQRKALSTDRGESSYRHPK
jgi:MscS family membrane protein